MLTRVEREKQVRRESIIDSAENLFLEKGYHQTTMDEIAKGAEFTKKTIYKYFTSKQEIYYEIAYRAFKALKDYTDDIITIENRNGYEKTMLFATRYIDFLRSNALYSQIMLEMNPRPDRLNDEEKQIFEKTDEVSWNINIIQLIEEGIKDGSILTNKTPFEVNFMLWGALNGIVAIAISKKKMVEEMIDKRVDCFINESVEMIMTILKG